MLFIIGLITVIVCVLGGYMMHGGKLYILWQPSEVIIIVGSGIGAFIIANPMTVIKGVAAGFKISLTGIPLNKKASFLQILGFFFELTKEMRTKGVKAVEQHIDHPHDSELFKKYPILMQDHHIEHFICDNVRLIVMGAGQPNQLEDLMDEELNQHHKERHAVSAAIQTMADSFPALGIVAAVLGVIITMGSISEPPAILGKLIGAALVGTFLGILISYGMMAPLSKNIENLYNAEASFYLCLKIAILNFAKQISPQMIVEYTRKHMPNDVKPTFAESEEYINKMTGTG